MTDALDWFWSPFLDAAHVLWGIVLLAILAGVVLAGMWPLQVPGETSPHERRNLDHLGLVGERIFALIVRAMPMLLVVGAGLVFFPLAPPTALLLSSRARLAGEGGDWTVRWHETVRGAGIIGDDRCIDVGLLVDAASDRASAKSLATGGWRQDDPAARTRLTDIVKDVLTRVEPTFLPDPGVVSHRVETRVPRWVVESIEQSLLRGIMQRTNVRRVAVLAADRPTDFGMAWDLVEATLRHGSPAHQTDMRIDRVRTDDAIRIEQVIDHRHNTDTGRVEVRCLVSVRPAKEAQRLPVRLILKNPAQQAPVDEQTVAAADEYRLQPMRFTFNGVNAADAPEAIQQDTQPPRLVPFPVGPAAVFDGKIQLRLGHSATRLDDAAAWRATWRQLQEAPVFQGWRERMKGLGHRLDVLLGDQGAVVIDTQSTPGSIWVYPTGFDVARLNEKVHWSETRADDQGRKWRGQHTAANDIAGVLSWDLVPVVAESQQPTPASDRVVARRRPLGHDLSSGGYSQASAPPLTTRFPETLNAGERKILVSHLALDPVRQGVLLDEKNHPGDHYEASRLAVFWAALLDAARRAPEPGPDEPQDHRADYPVALLDSVTCQQLRAEALTQNLLPLLAGLLVYAVFLIRGIANAPPARQRGNA